MSANVESMFSVREMPWHREGTVVQDYPENWEAARKLAGLEWDQAWRASAKDVSGAVVYNPETKTWDGTPQWELDPTWGSIVRSDTGATLFHMQRDSYALITNTELGQIVEALLGTGKNVKWETGGSLEGGKLVWILVTLDEPITVPGDKGTYTLPFLAVTNRCDGFGSCVGRALMTRIVCANTFRAAEMEGDRTGATFKFVHRGSWKDHIEDAKAAITRSRDEVAHYVEVSKELLAIKVNAKQRELFVREFIPSPPDGLVTERVSKNIEEARSALRAVLDGPTCEKIKGTAYGLVQAGGEYADHVRTARTWETRLNRNIMRDEPLRGRAAKLAREVAAAEV